MMSLIELIHLKDKGGITTNTVYNNIDFYLMLPHPHNRITSSDDMRTNLAIVWLAEALWSNVLISLTKSVSYKIQIELTNKNMLHTAN